MSPHNAARHVCLGATMGIHLSCIVTLNVITPLLTAFKVHVTFFSQSFAWAFILPAYTSYSEWRLATHGWAILLLKLFSNWARPLQIGLSPSACVLKTNLAIFLISFFRILFSVIAFMSSWDTCHFWPIQISHNSHKKSVWLHWVHPTRKSKNCPL